eukprot:527364_1
MASVTYIFCTKCGIQSNPESNFCFKCGTKLQKDVKSHPNAMKQGAAVNINYFDEIKVQQNLLPWDDDKLIIKNSASHLHHRCHDAMSDNDYLIKCDNYTISYQVMKTNVVIIVVDIFV